MARPMTSAIGSRLPPCSKSQRTSSNKQQIPGACFGASRLEVEISLELVVCELGTLPAEIRQLFTLSVGCELGVLRAESGSTFTDAAICLIKSFSALICCGVSSELV